jgi:hypothetical protein
MPDWMTQPSGGMSLAPAIPNFGSGGAFGQSSFTPKPYGTSYGDDGLVYGLGPRQTFRQSYGTGSLAQIAKSSRSPYFDFARQNSTELGRAQNWITGTLSSDQEKARYEGYFKRFFPSGASFDSYQGLWAQASQYAAQVNRDDPNARWSTWDALDRMWKMFSSGGGAGGGGGPTSYTNRSTQINLTGRDESDATLDQALTEMLGRTATDQEKARFLKALNAEERANPSTSVTRGTQSGSSSTSSTTSQSSSVSAGARALDFATEQEGFAEYQYATTYMDAMLEALSSPVR